MTQNLIPVDYAVMDVLMEGPDGIHNIAGEIRSTHETVRRSIHRLKVMGYVREKMLERKGRHRPTVIYELERTRKAA